MIDTACFGQLNHVLQLQHIVSLMTEVLWVLARAKLPQYDAHTVDVCSIEFSFLCSTPAKCSVFLLMGTLNDSMKGGTC